MVGVLLNVRAALDKLRELGYNIGYGKYSPQDLIDAGIVKEK